MNEKVQKIYNKLNDCNLAEVYRIYVMNPNNSMECLVCHLMLSDRFQSFEELIVAVRNCLEGIPVTISRVNDSRITITPR